MLDKRRNLITQSYTNVRQVQAAAVQNVAGECSNEQYDQMFDGYT